MAILFFFPLVSSLSLLLLFYIIKLIFEKVKRIVNKTSYDEYFKDKTIFITGASSGIGESLCKQLIQFGAKKIIIASRNLKEMNRVKQEC